MLILYNVVMLWIISGRGGFSQHPLDMSWNIIQLSCEVSCLRQSPIVRLRWLQRVRGIPRASDTARSADGLTISLPACAPLCCVAGALCGASDVGAS